MKKQFVRFELVNYKNAQRFKFNPRNRNLSTSHLAKIKKQCLESLDTMPPIIVNLLTWNVVDGQHRLVAFNQLIEDGSIPANSKIKVMYVKISADEEEIQTIININLHGYKWSQENYIESYTKGGTESYEKLETWCKSHSLACDKNKAKYRYGAAIIKGKNCSKILKDGTFALTDEELVIADIIHAEMMEILQLFELRSKGHCIEALAIAWNAARSQHDFKTWLKGLKAKKRRLMKFQKDTSEDWNNIFAQVHLAIDKKSAKNEQS